MVRSLADRTFLNSGADELAPILAQLAAEVRALRALLRENGERGPSALKRDPCAAAGARGADEVSRSRESPASLGPAAQDGGRRGGSVSS